MKPVVIYPPTVDWDYLHQRPQQLFKALSGLNCTCVFGNINCDKRYSTGFITIKDNLVLANGQKFGTILKWVRANLPNQPIVAYFTLPSYIDELLAEKVDLIIFDSIDEPLREFANLIRDYERAVKSSDVIFATARSLVARVQAIDNKTVVFLPNGCDYEHFKLAQSRQRLEEDPFNRSKPVIGYIGAIAPWLDTELINQMALSLPNYEFVFIGPLFAQRWAAFPHRNMHYLRYKEYSVLPQYLSNFEYCLIPFRINEMTRGVNPVKFWEYLASGIPILSTPLPEIDPAYATIITKDSFPGFAFPESSRNRAERIQLAQENSWTNRALKVFEIICNKLECG